AADGEALEPAFVDQRPGGLGPTGVLEGRAATRLIEGRARLAPAQQLALELLQLCRRLLTEAELGFDDDPVNVAGAVLERDLFARELLHLALRVHHRDFSHDLRELGAVAAGVHVDPAAHGAGDPEKSLDAHEPR